MKKSPDHLSDDIERNAFHLERLILFSDAVFAIAITLLIIEIKTPVLAERSTAALIEALAEKFSEFFGFLLSFIVIGTFWISHHKLFGFVTGYTRHLIWLNLLMLLWIVFVPFTSGLNSHYGGMDSVWMIYSLNMFMIAISLYFIYRYVRRKDLKISLVSVHAEEMKYASRRVLVTACVFLTAALLCTMGWRPASRAARFIYFFIPVAIYFVNKPARKKPKAP
jgi:uncharacterized membrane protein